MNIKEGRHCAEFLLSEAEGNLSRDMGTIAQGPDKLAPGTILTLSEGKYAPAHADQSADAVLFAHVDPTSGDVIATLITRSAELIGEALTFGPDVITPDARAIHIDQLSQKHLIIR